MNQLQANRELPNRRQTAADIVLLEQDPESLEIVGVAEVFESGLFPRDLVQRVGPIYTLFDLV